MLTLLQTAMLFAQQGKIGKAYLLAMLLGNVPPDLLPVLQESGLTLTNLQQYNKENP